MRLDQIGLAANLLRIFQIENFEIWLKVKPILDEYYTYRISKISSEIYVKSGIEKWYDWAESG